MFEKPNLCNISVVPGSVPLAVLAAFGFPGTCPVPESPNLGFGSGRPDAYAVFFISVAGIWMIFHISATATGDAPAKRVSGNSGGELSHAVVPVPIPSVAGLKIAARSVSCDDTGGDFYDFLSTPDLDGNRVRITVGDVADHGKAITPLMISARACLHKHAARAGTLAGIANGVNSEFVNAVEDSGQFMTLYSLDIDTEKHRLSWVRAGHHPAIIYDPDTDRFELLKGSGIAMGVDPDWRYTEQYKNGLCRGQIILIGTDGIWEAHNADGCMFGKHPVLNIVRKHAGAGPERILKMVFDELNVFMAGEKAEDDATLVVVELS
ncbi:MAG: serine/threonine-protein phosphatase [Desulfobacteraceae bacterium]|nr:serine/threonine-protein phosphatase [Desulfobacteraceae bacterium]